MRRLSDSLTLPSTRLGIARHAAGQLFPHRCDLWKPADVLLGMDRQVLDNRPYALAAQDQPCRLDSTPETDEPTPLGRSKRPNLFVLDVFLFPSGVEVLDTWIIVFRTPGDNLNDVWLIQGNPQSAPPEPLHLVGQQRVVALRTTTLPAGVTLPGAPSPTAKTFGFVDGTEHA